MRFTDRALTSSALRKPKSTPVMADETGWDVFMAGDGTRALGRLLSGVASAQRDHNDRCRVLEPWSSSKAVEGGQFFGARQDFALGPQPHLASPLLRGCDNSNDISP